MRHPGSAGTAGKGQDVMKIIVVKGYKKTGKTTTCTQLIGELVRRGYSVGSSKDTHFEGFAMDRPGTDSHRHACAGASTVIISGPEETDVLYQRRVEIRDLLHLYTEDWVVCEGGIGLQVPNVVTGKTTEDLDRRMDENTIAFAGIIAGDLTQYRDLPVISAVTEIEKLTDLIEDSCVDFSGGE